MAGMSMIHIDQVTGFECLDKMRRWLIFSLFIHTLFLAIIFHYHKCYYGQIGRGLMEICCTICVLVTWTQWQYEGHNNCVTLCIHPRRNVCFEVCRLEDWRHEAYTNFIFIYFFIHKVFLQIKCQSNFLVSQNIFK